MKTIIQAKQAQKDLIASCLNIEPANIIKTMDFGAPQLVDDKGQPVVEINEKTGEAYVARDWDFPEKYNVVTTIVQQRHIGHSFTLANVFEGRQGTVKAFHNVYLGGIKDQKAFEALKKLPEFAAAFGTEEESRVGADDSAEDVGF